MKTHTIKLKHVLESCKITKTLSILLVRCLFYILVKQKNCTYHALKRNRMTHTWPSVCWNVHLMNIIIFVAWTQHLWSIIRRYLCLSNSCVRKNPSFFSNTISQRATLILLTLITFNGGCNGDMFGHCFGTDKGVIYF